MEKEIGIEKFCGIDLFIWKEWDMIDNGSFYFYDVIFCMESMKKYDGCDVLRQMDGTMEIYAEEGKKVVWTGFVTDVAEVAAKLSDREDNNALKGNKDKFKVLSRLHFIPYEEPQHIIVGVFDEQHIESAMAEVEKKYPKDDIMYDGYELNEIYE